MYCKSIVVVLAAMLAASDSPARAATVCASTAQELQDALTSGSNSGPNSGTGLSIHLVQGSYKTGSTTGNGPFHYVNSDSGGNDLLIDGGWNSGCSRRTNDASLTVLDGHLATQVLSLRKASGLIQILWVTIQNGDTDADGGGLSVNAFGSDNSAVSVEASIFRNNHSGGIGGGVSVHGQAVAGYPFLDFSGNVSTGNRADIDSGAGRIIAGSTSTHTIVENNTVADNTTPATGGTGGLHVGGDGYGTIINNIFWGNSNYGVFIGAYSHTTFDYNDFGTMNGQAPDENLGNVSLNPRFVDAANGNCHLAGNSPALAATPDLNGTDMPDGFFMASRGMGDLGAYQETIFIDGLEH